MVVLLSVTPSLQPRPLWRRQQQQVQILDQGIEGAMLLLCS